MTIKDLAAQTGYSVGTVSRVLNNHPNVSPKARAAIEQAIAESGFERNINACQLKQTRASSILVLVKGTGNELFREMVEIIQARLSQTPYSPIADYIPDNGNEVRRAIALIREKKPLGILFLGGTQEHFLADFGKISIPCVLVTGDGTDLGFPNLSSIRTDDREAAFAAVSTLIALGHRHIAMIGGDPTGSGAPRLRWEGFRQALETQCLSCVPELCRSAAFTRQEGYEAALDLLSSGQKFTALFAAADVLAIGAIRALRDRGLRVPEDVSVIGMDGLPLGEYLVPRLATVAQSTRPMAQRSVELLLDAIENTAEARHETLPFTVLDRESIRAAE